MESTCEYCIEVIPVDMTADEVKMPPAADAQSTRIQKLLTFFRTRNNKRVWHTHADTEDHPSRCSVHQQAYSQHVSAASM